MKVRRLWAAVVLAVLALLAGIGSFTAAVAFPASLIEQTIAAPDASRSCCEKQGLAPLAQCGAQICHAIIPSPPEPPAQIALTEAFRMPSVRSLEGVGFQPDPPPPKRIGQEQSQTRQLENDR